MKRMLSCLLLLLLAAGGGAQPVAAQTEGASDVPLETRGYFLPRSFFPQFGALAADVANTTNVVRARATVPNCATRVERTMVDFLSDLGIAWPSGSSARYISAFERLVVCNTRKNLDDIGRIVTTGGCATPEIQIDLQFVSFDLANIARVAVSGITTEKLTALWTNGCGELLAAPSVITKTGQEAVVKGATELSYPTEFNLPLADAASATNGRPAAADYPVPGAFEMREVGTVLQVVPELSSDGSSINLSLSPQMVEAPQWQEYGHTLRDADGQERTVSMKQPCFHVYSALSTVSVESGKRILLGGGLPSSDGKRAVYIFVTATQVDPQGRPVWPLPMTAP